MVTGNPCSNGRIRLIKDPALKQALSVSCIKCSEVHSKSFYCTKLTDYSLKNKKLKDLAESFKLKVNTKYYRGDLA